MTSYGTYQGRLYDERQPENLDFKSPFPPDSDPHLEEFMHYLEVRPRTDADGEPLIVLGCTCGWSEAITDIAGGDDFITPWEIMELARRHYGALVAGHKISASEVEQYRLSRAELEERGIIIFDGV